MPKVIKLGKKDDLVSVIQQIKNLKDKEIVFELEKGSVLLSSSSNLKLIKRTGETLNKKVSITTNDELGRLLAIKAGVLADQTEEDLQRMAPRKSDKSGSKKQNFSDMRVRNVRTLPKQTLAELHEKSTGLLPKQFKNKKASRLIVAVAAGLAIAIIALGFFLPRADILIYARSEPITRDLDVKVNSNVTAFDASILVIPGKVVTRELSETKNFPATGTNLSGSKAAGKVSIFNGTKNTLTLKASTTILVADGKKFLFTKDVKGIKANANTPADIVAEQVGEGYNLPADTKFQIKNQALGDRPEVYATASSPLSGGSATAQVVVSALDLEQALSKTVEQAIGTFENELAASDPGTRLLVSSAKKEILAQTANKNAGDLADNFDFTVIVRLAALTFNEQDVNKLLKEQIGSVLSDDKYLVEGASQKLEAQFRIVDLDRGIGMLAVHYSTLVAYKIDANNLARILAGKKSGEIKEILMSKPEVDKVDVKLWPFFVKRAPRFNGKVFITTALSQM